MYTAIITLGAGVVLQRIGDGATNAPAFFYALANAATLTIFYSLVVGTLAATLNITWVILVLIVPLTVTTHWGIDWLRARFDALFYHAPVQRLRRDLRHLLSSLEHEESLEQRLRPLLIPLVRQVESPCAVVLLREGEGWQKVASYPGDVDPPLAANLPVITQRAPYPLPPPATVTAGPAWGVPLFVGGEGYGVLVVWSNTESSLNDRQLHLLDEGGEHLTTLLESWQAQSQRLSAIETLAATYQAEAATLRQQQLALADAPTGPEPAVTDLQLKAREWIEEATRNLSNVTYLGQHPIAQLNAITPYLSGDGSQPQTHLERGQAVRRLLETLIERLRPAPTAPPEPLPPEWRLYSVLHAAYIENIPNREIMSQLYIGEGTFHRTRRQALTALAQALIELEEGQ